MRLFIFFFLLTIIGQSGCATTQSDSSSKPVELNDELVADSVESFVEQKADQETSDYSYLNLSCEDRRKFQYEAMRTNSSLILAGRKNLCVPSNCPIESPYNAWEYKQYLSHVDYSDFAIVNNDRYATEYQKLCRKLTGITPHELFVSALSFDSLRFTACNLVTFDNAGNEIDGLCVYYEVPVQAYYSHYSRPIREPLERLAKRNKALSNIRSSGMVSKRFVIDKFSIIHTYKNHTIGIGDTDTIVFQGCEMWKIKDNGRFARFYAEDGLFQDVNEKGAAQNHLREGQWIETRPNGYTETYTYMEGTYQEGEPTGDFSYYEWIADLDRRGNRIPGTESKGKLLYTETYENGEMTDRTFLHQKEENPEIMPQTQDTLTPTQPTDSLKN